MFFFSPLQNTSAGIMLRDCLFLRVYHACSALLLLLFCLFFVYRKTGTEENKRPRGIHLCVCVWVFVLAVFFFLSVVYFDLESKTTCTCHTTDQHYY